MIKCNHGAGEARGLASFEDMYWLCLSFRDATRTILYLAVRQSTMIIRWLFFSIVFFFLLDPHNTLSCRAPKYNDNSLVGFHYCTFSKHSTHEKCFFPHSYASLI
jgi:hypothetical protein